MADLDSVNMTISLGHKDLTSMDAVENTRNASFARK